MRLSQARIFLLLCLSLIGGIGLASWFGWFLNTWPFFWFMGGLTGLGLALVLGKRRLALVAAVGGCICFGVWRLLIVQPVDGPDRINHYLNNDLIWDGLVVNEPEQLGDRQRLEARIRPAGSPGRSWLAGSVLITTNAYPAYAYGDQFVSSGLLVAPKPFDDFAYDRWLARQGIYALCYYPSLEIVSHNQGHRVWSAVFSLKGRLRRSLALGLNSDSLFLAEAMILGDKHAWPAGLTAAFSRSGLSHLAAISGLHIGLLSALILAFGLGIGLSRQKAFYFTLAIIGGYLILIGCPASACRAAFMVFLALLAIRFGRLSKSWNALVLAAVILLLINPKLLRDDVGFQLSFLAVAGILTCLEPLSGRLERLGAACLPRRWAGARAAQFIYSGFAVTFSAQVFTWPLVAYNFNTVSLVAPLANLLVIWSLPLVMVMMFLGAGLSLAVPALAPAWLLQANLLLRYVVAVARGLSNWPYAAWQGQVPGWAWLFYGLALGTWLWRLKETDGRQAEKNGIMEKI